MRDSSGIDRNERRRKTRSDRAEAGMVQERSMMHARHRERENERLGCLLQLYVP